MTGKHLLVNDIKDLVSAHLCAISKLRARHRKVLDNRDGVHAALADFRFGTVYDVFD